MVELFNRNYKDILLRAKRITQRDNRRLAPDLINETYIVLHDKQTKHPTVDFEFIKWYAKCMKNYYVWQNSTFNKHNRVKDSVELNESHLIDTTDLDLEIAFTTEETKELISISSGMKQDRLLTYLQVIEFKETLPLHERYIFELYFENGLSARAMAEQLTKETGYVYNWQRLNVMVNSIKTKIKQVKWQHLNS